MNTFRDPNQQQMSVVVSPHTSTMGGPPQLQGQGQPPLQQHQQPLLQQQQQQQQQQAGPHGVGMGRGASNNPSLQQVPINISLGQHPSQTQLLLQDDNGEYVRLEQLLNSYIYEHLLKSGFYKAARGLMQETTLKLNVREESSPKQDNEPAPPSRRSTGLKRSSSTMDGHPNSSPNEKTNGKSPRSGADSSPSQDHSDLPMADVPLKGVGESSFLRGWWNVFWDVFAARGNLPGAHPSMFAQNYLEAQRNQGRIPQHAGQQYSAVQHRMQMNGVGEDVNMDKSRSNMVHTAIVNSGRKATRQGQQLPMPQAQQAQMNQSHLMAMKQQQAQQQQQQAQQAEGDNGSSPALGQVNSPNKRPRLTPPNEFAAPLQIPLQGPPNGMPGMQQPPNLMVQQAFSNPAQFLKQNGIPVPPNASPQDVMNIARTVVQNYQQQQQSKQLTTYNRTLAAHQSQQVLNNRPPVPSQNPANPQGPIQFTNPLSSLNFPATGPAAAHPPTPAQLAQLDQVAKQLGGSLSHPITGSHSLADYQNQLMVLEQQNKKRLQHARQETNGRDDPGNGQQFPPPQGVGLQPGGTPLAGTSMSPSNSRTGPSPQISNSELQGQRKQGQKTGSGAASPESEGQIRGPSPAFVAQQGVMTPDLAQMAQMSGQGYQHPLVGPNGQPIPFGGRPHPGMPFNQGQPQMSVEMMKRMQPGQFTQNWQQPVSQQAFNPMNPALRQQGMVPGQHPGPQTQQMPPPSQPPQPGGPGTRLPAPSESPSLQNANPPTPNPTTKSVSKAKATKERPKRNRGKANATPATPNAPETPATPTTPMTPHPQHPFNQQQVPNPAGAPGQQPPANQPPLPESSQPQAPPAQPPPQESAPPAPFSTIDHADANNDSWTNAVDEKWITSFHPGDFGNSFGAGIPDFSASNFGIGTEDDIINYGEFLNEDGVNIDLNMNMWEELPGTEV